MSSLPVPFWRSSSLLSTNQKAKKRHNNLTVYHCQQIDFLWFLSFISFHNNSFVLRNENGLAKDLVEDLAEDLPSFIGGSSLEARLLPALVPNSIEKKTYFILRLERLSSIRSILQRLSFCV